MMNSFAFTGLVTVEESTGVGGIDALPGTYEVGVGLEGSLDGAAIGSVKERRFAFLDAGEVALE